MTLGEYLKNYRTTHGLNMQEIANRAGLSKGYISMLEKNQHPQSRRKLTPSFETYKKIAIATNIEIDDLLSLLADEEVIVNATNNISNVTVPEARELPILGEICAGDGIFCEENYEGTFCVDNTIKADYCLRVRGDSMIDAGIEAGDMAFIARAYDFHDGDIYAVLKNGEYTASLKRVYLQADQIVLAACSTAYAPEILAAGDVSILGEFVGVYKPKKT